MDGTFGGGDLISASLAIMLGGTDAELHDKEVTLTTSDVTGSQTAIFEYDPQNEPTTGTPPGPWDGYSLFTIDLSGVKDDIEAMQAQIEALEDELEEMQECCDEVVDVIHDYDPTYDPHPVPPDPTNPTIPEKIQEIIDEESGYEFPPDVTLPEISELIAGESTVSTPTSEWEIEVFLYAESYDGSVTKRVRTLHTGGESWFFRPAISFIHGDEEHVVMPTNYRYQIGPSASEWVSITGWSIDSDTTVSLSWINQDGYTRSWSGSYAGANLTPLMTGPYIVKNK